MKKYSVFFLLATTVIIFSYCSSSKKANASKMELPKLVYENSVQTIIAANCSPCHLTAKAGRKRPYDNYANVKSDIDSIIYRIELHPGDKGFMPFKKSRLNDSTIAVFKQWKADGSLEK